MRPGKRLEEIRKLLNFSRYNFDTFWKVCPYPLEVLISSRKAEYIKYLHVGIVWARLCGMTQMQTGEYFKRDHSTIVDVEKNILISLESPKFGNKSYIFVFKELKELDDLISSTLDVWQDYLSSLVLLENLKQVKYEKRIRESSRIS